MKKISGSTLYVKSIFPGIWFGMLAIFFFLALLFWLISGTAQELIEALFLFGLMGVFGYIFFHKITENLADEVYDEGESLLFRKGGEEQRVKFEDINKIRLGFRRPHETIVLQFRTEGALGKKLAFLLPFRFNRLSINPVFKELKERVDSARNN